MRCGSACAGDGRTRVTKAVSMADSDTSYDSDDNHPTAAGAAAVAEAEARQAALEREREALQAADRVSAAGSATDAGVKRRSLKMDNDEVCALAPPPQS